ncbi:MAG TPA: Sec-independent protein translocase subunit TatA [Jatrophihabitans sp.]|jgi:sec-independent protein translocase protein TatA|nr:Sec-independent protein translocase subunit TatA [Jatrophihabitans sp.]
MELFSPGHLIVLAIVVAVLFFGWKQLPDMARSLGRSLRIFKTEIKGMSEDDKAREAAKAEPQAIEAPASESAAAGPQPPAGSESAATAAQPATAPEPPKLRPRPVPNANGRTESSAKAE